MFSLFIGLVVAGVCMAAGTEPMEAVDTGLYAAFVSACITTGLILLLALFTGIAGMFASDGDAVGIGLIATLFYTPMHLAGIFGFYLLAASFTPDATSIPMMVTGLILVIVTSLVVKLTASSVGEARKAYKNA
jgi:hypothetical protein